MNKSFENINPKGWKMTFTQNVFKNKKSSNYDVKTHSKEMGVLLLFPPRILKAKVGSN